MVEVRLPRSGQERWAQALTAVFFAASVLAPAAPINKVAFGLLVLQYLLAPHPAEARQAWPTRAPLLILTVFAYGALLSLATDVDEALRNQLLLSVLVLFAILPVCRYRVDLDTIVRFAGLLLAAVTVLGAYFAFAAPASTLGSAFQSYFTTYGLGSVSEREFLDDPTVVLHLAAAPFLFLPFSLYLEAFLRERRARDLGALLLVLGAVVLSGSRGMMAICALGALVLVLRSLGRRGLALALGGAVALVPVGLSWLLTRTSILSGDEVSNAIKIGHVSSFAAHVDAWTLLFGEGLGASYVSAGRNALLAHTEITPLDLTRYFGAFGAAAVYLAVLVPDGRLSSLRGEGGLPAALMGLYLLLSLTNPVLFNSAGLLVVLWYWRRYLAQAAPGRAASATEGVPA